MGELAWLYVHGGWVWLVLAVPFAWLGSAAARWRLAFAAARQARVARASLVDAATLASGCELVVRGRLVDLDAEPGAAESGEAHAKQATQANASSPIAWTVLEDYGELHARAPGKTLAIAHEDGPVRLDGTLAIVAGSGEAVGIEARQMGAWVNDVPPPRTNRVDVRTVTVGDEVIARGTLIEEPPAAGTARSSYRTAPVQRTLRDVRIASVRAPTIVIVRRRTRIVGAIAGLVAGAFLLGIGGEAAMARARKLGPLPADGRDVAASASWPGTTQLSWLSLAAASPFSRREALGLLLAELDPDDVDVVPTRPNAERVHLLLDDCEGAVDMWTRHGEPERANGLAQRCHLPPASGAVYFERGELDAASRAFAAASKDDTLVPAMAHLAAHRYGLAATSVRTFTATHEPRGDVVSRDRGEALDCIADALDTREGNTGARARLLRSVSHRAMCRVLYADLVHGEERRATLRPQGNGDNAGNATWWAWIDNQGVDFAKGWVIDVEDALYEEELGQLTGEAEYDYALVPKAAVTSASWESNHRSSVPVGLFHAIDAKVTFVPGVDDRFCQTVRGNEALFLAMLGDMDEARALAARTPGAKDVGLDDVLDILATNPEQVTKWAGPGANGSPRGLYDAMDRAAYNRRFLHGLHGVSAKEEEPSIARVHRFRDAVLDRAITVPLQMLEAFAER